MNRNNLYSLKKLRVLIYYTLHEKKTSDYDLKINIKESWDNFSKSRRSKARESHISKLCEGNEESARITSKDNLFTTCKRHNKVCLISEIY